MTSIFVGLHVASMVGLSIYGLLGFVALWIYIQKRELPLQASAVAEGVWPNVTVQLPLYNEPDVVQRLIHAIAALDYPHDRLEIQILDDSTDETTALATHCAEYFSTQGLDIKLHRRLSRTGFKSGALQLGLVAARGEFIAIFDADFVPQPDFLRQTVPFFLNDRQLGSVQARWGHLNATKSLLTGAQSVALDKHFAIEQLVRHRANFFPKFNGSAGVWRKAAIQSAGGWHDDTVCEDLCLSTRAVLDGWNFHFLPEVIAPADLPESITAYKTQQARWTMGSTQCLMKYRRSIWQAQGQSLAARVYALLSMSAYLTNGLVLLLLLTQLPIILMEARPPTWLYILSLFGLGQPLLFILAQYILYKDWVWRLRYLPVLLVIAIGLAPSNTSAIIAGLRRTDFVFDRTPKGKAAADRPLLGWLIVFELFLALYCAITLMAALWSGNTASSIFLLSATLGLGYVGISSLGKRLAARDQNKRIIRPIA